MSLAADIQLGFGEKFRGPAECIVSVEDKPIEALYPYLREVTVEMTRGLPTLATLVFETVREATGRWVVQDSGTLRAWKRIKIQAAWDTHVEEVMRGYIKDVKADYPEDMGSASVTVTAQDETLLLDRVHRQKTWSTEDVPVSDGHVMKQIAEGIHHLQVKAEPGLQNRSLHQDATDIQFLFDRAEANGFELFTREGTLYFGPIRLDGQPQPTILVYAGKATNCLRFSTHYDGHRPDAVRITRAAEQGDGIEEESFRSNLTSLGDDAATSDALGLEPFAWRLTQPLGSTLEEVRARAQAKANENAWKVAAEGELDGALYGQVLLTHQTVVVDGVGDTFGGLYYVDHVQHRFSAEGYQQSFRLLRNATGGEASAATSFR